MTRRLLGLLAAALLLLLPACAGGGDSAESAGATAEVEAETGGREAEEGFGAADAGGQSADSQEEAAEGGGEDTALPDIALQVDIGERIIKDGTVSIEVAEGGFDEAFRRVVEAAERLGGTSVSSTTDNTDGRGPSGSITVRVPVEEYDRFLIGVREFGQVRARSITSEDVSTEYVDLQARLRQQQAQERFYLGLLREAEDVQDAIAVQQQLQSIQTDIERLKGRLQFLDAKTAFSTLTVELFEPGAAPPVLTDSPAEPSLAEYWAQARRALVTVVGLMLVVGTSLLPFAVPLVIGLVVWRAVRRPTTAPAE
ncbi:MAG: DUF4349 domain-containing protein [Egibacteraceae bacterium]